jgi:methylmalonyl-CoA/ethylmalonyl-CoA epimerase
MSENPDATSGLLTEIDHVAIAVKDLDAAIDYYQRAFGATVAHREVVDSDGVDEALIKVADSYIQLTAATRPDSPIAKSIEKRGEGLHHIGYRVDDCQAALDAMVAAGATAIDTAPAPGSRGTTVAFGDLRVPRPERCREVHHHQDAVHPGHPHRGHRPRRGLRHRGANGPRCVATSVSCSRTPPSTGTSRPPRTCASTPSSTTCPSTLVTGCSR